MIFAGTLSCVLCQQRTRRGVTIIEWQLAGQGAPCMAPYNGDNCELSIIGTHRVLGSAQYLSSSPRDCHHTALCALWPPLNRCSQLGPLSCIFCANKHHYYFHMSSTLIICHSLYRSLIELLQWRPSLNRGTWSWSTRIMNNNNNVRAEERRH